MPITINGTTGISGVDGSAGTPALIGSDADTGIFVAAGQVSASVNGVAGNVPLVQGTAQDSTSGTSIDFTGIPSWVKRVTVMFNGVSLTNFASEANSILVQLGDSGGVENSSYTQGSGYVGPTSGIYSRTDGFHVGAWAAAGNTVQGVMQIVNHNGNLWCASGVLYHSGGYIVSVAGSKTLSATLDRIRITTVNGTDTFDAGSINILYE